MIRVLVVDGDLRVAAVHAEFTAAVPGFTVAGVAHSVTEARAGIRETAPDLVLLDVTLPDGSGLNLVRELEIDMFVLSAADDPAAIRAALRAGAAQYLIKPFTEEQLAARLAAYRDFRDRLTGERITQEVLDAALMSLHGKGSVATARPSHATTRLISELLRAADAPLSAAEVARELGIARATAQRHLGSLAERGELRMSLRYGTTGRPEHEYRWAEHVQ